MEFAHIAIRLVTIHPHFKFTHVGGRIAIRPYTCVFWTFANIHVNTQKASWAWCEYVCVCRRGELKFVLVTIRPCYKFAHIANRPCYKFTPISNRPHFKFPMLQIAPPFQIPPFGRANCNSPLHVCFLNVRKYTCKYTKNIMGMV